MKQQAQRTQTEDVDSSFFERSLDPLQQLMGNSGALEFLGLNGGTAEEEAPVDLESLPVVVVEPFDDGGGYFWRPETDGHFTCVETPEGKEKALGFSVTEQGQPEAWARLDAIYQEKRAELAPELPLPDLQPPGGEEDSGSVVELIPELWEDLKDAAGEVWDGIEDTWDSAQDWWGDLWGEEEEHGGDVDSGKEEPTEEEKAHDDAVESGKTDVLDEAIDLADTSTAGHAKEVARDHTFDEIWDELKSGEIDDLDALWCSEFTTAAVAAAGYDLNEVWRDPGTGKKVAYEDKGASTFVEAWMVVGTLKEATDALMAVQDNDSNEVEEISAGSDRATAVGQGDEAEDFLYVSAGTFVGREASEDDLFGAGAVAVLFGGTEVELEDRLPGDIQQALKTNSQGTYTGAGHSSVVHAVEGYGVARVGETGSPEIIGGVKSPATADALAPGWYRIEAGSDLRWSVGPDTDPASLAAITTTHVQLIDANIAGNADESGSARGGDATQVGFMNEQEDFDDSQASATTCAGRLPSSPWFPWTTSEPDIIAVLSTVEPTESQAQQVL
ncbi:MAG: hypothetical protein AAFV53_09085 [Myxococcota bacterium]